MLQIPSAGLAYPDITYNQKKTAKVHLQKGRWFLEDGMRFFQTISNGNLAFDWKLLVAPGLINRSRTVA
jgi:hypothetical protein